MATLQKPLKIEFMDIERLLLDPDNPRLSSIETKRGQDELVQVLWNEMAVAEVALSIAANGYFEEEPLFIIPVLPKDRDASKQKYVVVEGNRRLAAVMLLRDTDLRRTVKATDLPPITAKQKDALSQLPVSVYPDKESLWEYFGFRHVNGPKEWDSFSKASYIADVRRKYAVPLEEIARKIGDQHSTVIRIYRGFVLLEQAEKATDFKREDRIANRFHFSHLYTAADQKEYQKFLGIDAENSLKDNPVQKSNLKHLEELMVWLFGSKGEGKLPVVEKQNPHLKHLRLVLGNKEALYTLRETNDLQRAYAVSLGESHIFQEALIRAKNALHDAKSTVTSGYKGESEMWRVMKGITELAQSIAEEMKKKLKE